MGFEKSKKTSFWLRYSNQLLLGTVVLILGAFLLFVRHSDIEEISGIADETLDFMRSVCIRYDNYAVGRRASNMKNLLDKTVGMASLTNAGSLTNADYLQRFLETQDLTGVLVTDGDLQPVAQLDRNGNDAYALWQNFLKADSKRNIVKYRNKTYSGTATAGEKKYRVCIVSRLDAHGLILCYEEVGLPATDMYETSLADTLENNTFHKNPTIVITDGEFIIASNAPALQNGMAITDCPIQQTVGHLWDNSTLVHMDWNRTSWYGKRLAYEQYLIYVFYPGTEVFNNMLPVICIAVAVYALLCLLMMTLRHITERKYRRRDQRQLNTIRAIASLFITTSVLHLDSDMIEGIISTPRAQEVLNETTRAKEVARLLAERIIAPEYRTQYVDFLDFTTMDARLKDKSSISMVCRDVNGIWFSVYLIPMEYEADGRLKHVLFASRDIDDFMKNEKKYQEELRHAAHDAEMANAAKTSFLRRMSHDLRTPINGIQGMAEMARQTLDTPEKAGDYIDKILASSGYLQSILEDILRMSKLESGRLALENRPFNLQLLLDETTDFIQERADENGIHFAQEIQLQHPHAVGSPLHLRQVIQNVLSNAVKFTPAGGSVKASFRETAFDGQTMQLEFICEDTGIGMSEAFRKHMFEPFEQEDTSARSQLNGTGLGLAIAKEILDLCGGTITATSTQGKGSTFTILVPLTVDTAQGEQLSAERDTDSIEGVRVLIAEDNEINMEIAHYMLETRGAVITEAHNGREALDLFSVAAPGSYDVILMDIMMPEMDGLEATRAIRAMSRADAKTIPIFAMTANAFVDDINLSIAAGMNEHLSKPLNIEEVIKTICRYTHK